MAYTTGTTHYNLPQTVGTDKRDWADTNQAFADVDAALYGAVSDVATAGDDITSLKSRMTTAEGNILTNTGDISALDTRLTAAEGSITTQAGQIADVRSDAEDMICAYNEATATSTHVYAIGDYFIYNDVLYRATQAIAIGDTIVPDTNCTTTNVSAEILSAFIAIANKSATALNTVTFDGVKTQATGLLELLTADVLNVIRSNFSGHSVYILINDGDGGLSKYNCVSVNTGVTGPVRFVMNTTYYAGTTLYSIRYLLSIVYDSGYVPKCYSISESYTGTGAITPTINVTDRNATVLSDGSSMTLYVE